MLFTQSFMTYCLNLRQLCHERDELRATSSSLTVELQQAAVGIPLVDDDDDNLILDAIECHAHSLPFHGHQSFPREVTWVGVQCDSGRTLGGLLIIKPPTVL